MNLKIEKTHPSVTTIYMEAKEPDWEQWFLLRSDVHHDNLLCDQALEKRHLEEALSRDAGIIDIGDCFDAMGGKWDKRADQSQMRQEVQGSNYLDKLVKYLGKAYAPYAKQFAHLSPGNHETAILRHHETNLTERLAEHLKIAGSPVVIGTFRGWIRCAFHNIGGQNNDRQSIHIHYHHGYGAGGPVTRGVISTNRDMVSTDADIILSGHTHDSFQVPIRRERLNHNGRPVCNDCECIKLGGYKDEYSPGQGWATERGHGPKTLGAYWLRFFTIVEAKHRRVVFETIRAK